MNLRADGSTNRNLLIDVTDWNNREAWVSFFEVYDPYLRLWCGRYGLKSDAIDEVCQRIWIELAERMKTFEYDPSSTFRGWLRRPVRLRVLNFLREGRAAARLGHEVWLQDASQAAIERDEPQGSDSSPHGSLLRQGEKVQAAVRARIKPRSWDAFWLVAVCDWSVERTAASLGMTHTAVYAARDRVARMLAEQGKRVPDEWNSEP